MTNALQHSPTTEHKEAWVRAYVAGYVAPPLLSPEDAQDPAINRRGKWLVFVDREHVEEVWAKVAEATRAGSLGDESKVSTEYLRGEIPRRPEDSYVIVAYSEEWTDVEDVRRVLRGIRDLGITQRLTYKRDAETHRGIYGSGSVYYRSPEGTDLVERV